MSTDIVWTDSLDADDISRIDALLDRVSHADGLSAISEHGHLLMRSGGGHGERHAVVRQADDIVGYAQVSGDAAPVAEFLVDPSVRSHGLGKALLDSVLAQAGPEVGVWAHGNLPAAAHLAADLGLVQLRRLCRYARALDDVPDVPLPPGIALRAFDVHDAPAWLELNAQAFTDLPDQGSWTMADLERRLDQSWFDPDGFLVAWDEQGLAGFHWTKEHSDHAGGPPIGEVYVLAVAERSRGTGLAAALTAAGLHHLRDAGLGSVMLFVDEENLPAVGLYTAMGFSLQSCDVLYGSQ